MINTYYLYQDNQQVGPFTQYEIMDMQLDVHTMTLSPLATDWQEMIDLPEFNYYFENRGIYPPNKTNYANFGWRFLAYLIDFVIACVIGIIFITGYFLFLEANRLPNHGRVLSTTQKNWINLFSFLMIIFYHSVFESSRLRGGVGKVVCKLSVVDVKGERLTFAKALSRNMGKILSSMIFGFGYLRILWNSKRQGWHDELAKAYVIRRK